MKINQKLIQKDFKFSLVLREILDIQIKHGKIYNLRSWGSHWKEHYWMIQNWNSCLADLLREHNYSSVIVWVFCIQGRVVVIIIITSPQGLWSTSDFLWARAGTPTPPSSLLLICNHRGVNSYASSGVLLTGVIIQVTVDRAHVACLARIWAHATSCTFGDIWDYPTSHIPVCGLVLNSGGSSHPHWQKWGFILCRRHKVVSIEEWRDNMWVWILWLDLMQICLKDVS